MSIRILKQGLLDTVQDAGRYGYQNRGINPGGVADNIAFSVANMLVGNAGTEGVIELHYPAATIQFEKDALIALSGANFKATINDALVPLNTPVLVPNNSVLVFTKPSKGYRCYLSVRGGFELKNWLGSCSTNIKAGAGGYKGRKLLADDVIGFKTTFNYPAHLKDRPFFPLGWKADLRELYSKQGVLRMCTGHEYEQLTGASKDLLTHTTFTVTAEADRMGCRLSGIPLQIKMPESLVSSGVTAGTIQLLPTGQLIILGADHQTTGGYPRIAHVISADIHLLAQLLPGETIRFEIVEIAAAENFLLQQSQYLLQLRNACNLRLEEFLLTYALH